MPEPKFEQPKSPESKIKSIINKINERMEGVRKWINVKNVLTAGAFVALLTACNFSKEKFEKEKSTEYLKLVEEIKNKQDEISSKTLHWQKVEKDAYTLSTEKAGSIFSYQYYNVKLNSSFNVVDMDGDGEIDFLRIAQEKGKESAYMLDHNNLKIKVIEIEYGGPDGSYPISTGHELSGDDAEILINEAHEDYSKRLDGVLGEMNKK